MIIYSPTFTGSVQITGSQTVTGDLTVQGNLTAQTFILSSSVSYFTESFASGSTRFGDSMDDTMVVTGSLRLTGSVGVNTTAPAYLLDARGPYVASGMLSIRSTDTATIDYGGVLGFGGFHNGSSNQGQWAAIKGAKENSNVNDNASYLSFGTQVSAGNITERMRISSVGAATFDTTGAVNATFNSTNANGGYIQFSRSSVVKGYLGSAAQLLVGGVNDIELRSNANLFLTATTDLKLYSRDTLALTLGASQAATFASSVTANSIVSSTTITSTGAIRSGGGTISSYYSTAANVNNGGNTTFTYQQTSGEYAVGFMYSIVGLYAPSGTNVLGVGQGYAYFFSDGSTNGTSTSAQIATGWSVAASATNAGAYTITFTNNSGATMSEVNYRIIKVNRVGAG